MTSTAALLLEDHHVHSTFSDGTSSLEENVEHAERRGLHRLGCVDHVRVDTTYVPAYAAAVRAVQRTTSLALTVGIEAKILDTGGRLDLPADGLDDVDLVYAADHQFPWRDGPRSPRVVKEWLDDGQVSPGPCIEALVSATIATMQRYRDHRLILAHLFSVLPKAGLAETQVPEPLLHALADVAVATGTMVEISERWHCPSLRTLRAFAAAGATVICSTDSHGTATIGRYQYVRATLEALTS